MIFENNEIRHCDYKRHNGFDIKVPLLLYILAVAIDSIL